MTGPKWRQVAAKLRERITLGYYDNAGGLESESELAAHYDASRITIRRALQTLRDEGLITSQKGSGWYVARDPVREVLGMLPSSSRALADAGVSVSRTVLEFGFTRPSPPIAALLAVPADSQALRARRLHVADGSPYDLITTWLPARVAGSVSRDQLQDLGAWETLRAHGVEPAHTYHSITAGLADPEHAQLLDIAPGDPLLLLRRLATDRSDTPVAISHHRFAAHHIRIDIEFHGEPSISAGDPPGIRLARAGDEFREVGA